MFNWANQSNFNGLETHRPVILPLQRAGGLRCSVKPASRGALHSKRHEARIFIRAA